MQSELWLEKNHQYLVENLSRIEIALRKFADLQFGKKMQSESYKNSVEHNALATFGKSIRKETGYELDELPAIDNICELFGLSTFERNVLLLCAGAELKSDIATLCAKVHGNPSFFLPSFGLTLALLPDAHWSALLPTSPLRYFRLISIIEIPNTPITKYPIRIEEKVLHYLTGVTHIDRQLLMSVITPVKDHLLPAFRTELVERIIHTFKTTNSSLLNFDYRHLRDNLPAKDVHPSSNLLSCMNLYGDDEIDKLSVAKFVCSKLGLDLWKVHAESLVLRYADLDMLIGIWSREAILHKLALYILVSEDTDNNIKHIISNLLSSDQIPKPVFLSTRKKYLLTDSITGFEVTKPSKEDQYQIWKECSEHLRNMLLRSDQLHKITDRFDFTASDIISVLNEIPLANFNSNDFFSALYESCGTISNARLSGLARRVRSSATMKDLVLPSMQKSILNSIVMNMKQRKKVYEKFGFANKSSRGLGVTSLFAGESGTGKTMAAEIMANELNLDLFKIDLSMVISKYIGETEKNLSKVFDAAQSSGCILFFDEADALFGKRSEVKDSHDRYANLEIADLLQRMEDYSGLAILATNMKSSIDTAFIRRIRFIVKFPYPDEESRAEIWRGVFPELTPVKDLDVNRLAKLNITGGTIRNIALNSAFFAADEGVDVNMKHIRHATKQEYEKMERPLTQQELRALGFTS